MPVRAAPTHEAALRKADRVSRDLLGRIVRGEVEVGSLLPREDELAKEYRVNRSVIREAIKLLEVHRLVRPIRRRGTEVLSPLASMSPEVLRAMLCPTPGVIDRHVLVGLLEIRACLDIEMMGIAAARRTRRDIEAMNRILVRMRAIIDENGDPHAYFDFADELSLAFARATKNPLFEMLAAWHRTVVKDLESLFVFVRAPSISHHQALVTLVEQIRWKDVEGARRVVTAFHAWSTPRLIVAASRARDGTLERLLERLNDDREP